MGSNKVLMTSTPVIHKNTATPSTPSHYKAMKPINLFTSSPAGKENTVGSSLESTPPKEKKYAAVVCDIKHLEDKSEEISNDTQYKTKAAILISKVVQHNPALQEFDILRNSLKSKKMNKQKPTLSEQERYELLLAQLHTAVTSSKSVLKQNILKFENEYYTKHGVLPREEEYSHLRKSLNLAKKLLIAWNSFSTKF